MDKQAGTVSVKVLQDTVGNTTFSHVKVCAPEEPAERKGIVIICVLDISGSMDIEATQGAYNQSDGFTRLDLVKHSVNTIIESLNENDSVGIVTFSNQGRVDFPITNMHEQGRAAARNVVQKMKTEGATNLWGGMKLGLDLSMDNKCKDKNTFVVVLSDGEPNNHPPDGQLVTTQNYIQQHPIQCSMSMFGYGYSLNTRLLAGLSELGGGCYGYIPDCSMVGTIFVNFLSAALATFSPAMTVQVTSSSGKLSQLNDGDKSFVKLGPIQYGMTRNVLIGFEDITADQYATVSLNYGCDLRTSKTFPLTKNDEKGQSVQTQYLRYKYLKFLEKPMVEGNFQLLNEELKALIEEMSTRYKQTNDEYLNYLIRDMQSEHKQEGQVQIALSNQEYWNKWGIHYFPALKIAHNIEMCTNFKDPGLKLYTGAPFKKYQNTIDTVFIKLPPPQPSIKKYQAPGVQYVAPQLNDMSNYYDEDGGCIAGQCSVHMGDGTKKLVEQVKAGDEVMTMNGKAKVKCVVRTEVKRKVQMVELEGGLLITKYHPIHYKGDWLFPIHAGKCVEVDINQHFNFVLDGQHSMLINGVACITLAHEAQHPVLSHQYFGSSKIISDLSRQEGWKEGLVNLPVNTWRRDSITRCVNGLMI